MTSSQHGSYVWGFTHATMGATKGRDTARWSESLKARLGSDCKLKLACMKLESLVTVGQHTTVNTFPGLVHTARQVMKVANTRRVAFAQP